MINTRAFSKKVAESNKHGSQAYRTLPYSVELRPRMGTYDDEHFNDGFIFDERHVSSYVCSYICLYIKVKGKYIHTCSDYDYRF